MFVCILQQEIRQIAAVTGMEKLPPFCVFCVCRFFMRKFDWRRMSSQGQEPEQDPEREPEQEAERQPEQSHSWEQTCNQNDRQDWGLYS